MMRNEETKTALEPFSVVGNNSPRLAKLSKRFALFLFCLFILFHSLGGAALFEPDEGRNAEIAREILLLNDWVTPHDNFVPALDKPIFFYWLIALCYKIFGVSEWSARLPSALAALGSVALVYMFVRKSRGPREAAWSALILLTNIETFLLARIVIFDAALTFFMTLSLCSFHWGARAQKSSARRCLLLLMYASFGAGTLLKGPIGLILPAMVICLYVLLSRNWALLRHMHLLLGSLVFFIIVAPWYIWVETRNPGYLRYFFWEENVVRFLTPHFQRTAPWYYFFLVLIVGFLPWSFLIPTMIRDFWKRSVDEQSIFVMVWTALPLLFFSLSSSKLPHYILPMYPALSIMTGETVARRFSDRSHGRSWFLYLPWLCEILPILYLSVGSTWPALLPGDIRQPLAGMSQLYLFGAMILATFAAFSLADRRGREKHEQALCVFYCLGLLVFFLFISQTMKSASSARSAKELARKTAPLIGAE